MGDGNQAPGSAGREGAAEGTPPRRDSQALVEDLFEGGLSEAAKPPAPLDPSEFGPSAGAPPDAPTERIDLEGAGRPSPSLSTAGPVDPADAVRPPWSVPEPGPTLGPARTPLELTDLPPGAPDALPSAEPATVPDRFSPFTLTDEPPLQRPEPAPFTLGDPAPEPPEAPAPFTLGAPSDAFPLIGSEPDGAAARALPPQELDLGLSVGSGPSADEVDMLGLPVGSQPREAPALGAPMVSAPRLPCTALVVAEDRAVGASVAAGLMAAGYTCRAATADEAAAVLAQPGIDVVVVRGAEVAPSGLASLERWSGPAVFLGSRPGAARPGWLHAEQIQDPGRLVHLVERARAEALVAAAASEAEGAWPGRSAAPLARVMRAESLTGGGHVELTEHNVRALLMAAGGKTGRGRVRSMAPSGQLLVDLTEPPPTDRAVVVELIVVDGRRAEIPGRVTRSGEGQALVELDQSDAQAEIVRSFISEAKDASQPAIEQVRIRERSREDAQAAQAFVDDATLRKMFDEAATKLDDDPTQQAFIQACIKADRLQLAVQCYRELKAEHPEDARVSRYLNQVGTILGFYAFRKEDPDRDDGGMPKTLKWTLFAFIFAVLILWVVVEVLAA